MPIGMDFLKIAYRVPQKGEPGYEEFDIKSDGNVLIIRAPLAADYLIMDEIKRDYAKNPHARYLAMAHRLSVSWNGQPGVSPVDLGSLSREAYKELCERLNQFQLDILSDSTINALPDSIKRLLNNKPNEDQEDGE